jgi:hypothetical protein
MEAGAGKQNAVVVIVVRRYARLVVIAGLGSLSSSIVTMMVDRISQAATVTVTSFYLWERECGITISARQWYGFALWHTMTNRGRMNALRSPG